MPKIPAGQKAASPSKPGRSAAKGKSKARGGRAQAPGQAPPRAKRVRGRVSVKALTEFTTQLSTLQDAGLPIVRSLKILEG